MAYRNVVVGTDGSETAEKAVVDAAELAGANKARLVIVTAFEPAHDHERGACEQAAPDDIRWMLADRNQAEEKARRGRELAKGAGAAEVVVQTADGDPAEVLLTAADDFSADLIVVGSKGLTGASRFILGSVASSVSHHAPCDVLVVHTTVISVADAPIGHDPRVSDDKTPVEQAIEQAFDVFVYAPIGLVFEGPALLPQLIEKGRNQVTMARMIGQFAVQQGGQEAPKLVGKLQEQAEGILALLGARQTAPRPAAPAPAAPATPAATQVRSSARAADLAITDYDSLSASQVVNRLAGLSAGELEAVRDYEADHRGRKTILNKVSQLQG